ncbi:MAG: TolC family protein, partial [Sporomusaceae bacterium]|nr:TolC family protein [Sporomusaceae bacterium]
MIVPNHWKKRLAAALTGGFLMLNTAAVLAAPVELSLDESIVMALQNNPAIKIADADREKSEWAISEARGGKMPTLSLSHSDSWGKSTT